MISKITAWVFDLDNTLYPAESSIYPAIGVRMSAYIMRALSCDEAEADEIRERYFHLYGATILGLVKHHGIDAGDFLDDVHQVDLNEIAYDLDLARQIAALPGQKYIFTNGAESYARRIAARLCIDTALDDIVGMDPIEPTPKPDPAAFHKLISRTGLDPSTSVYFDDAPINLETGRALGFRTVLIGEAPKPDFVDVAARDVREALKLIAG